MAVTTTTANGPQSSGGGGTWGSITGTLADQTDLQDALDLKAADADVVKLTGAQSIAGVKTFSDTTDATSATAGGTILSGGLAVAKKIYSGTGINIVTGNLLVTSGTVGRDTGVSGSLTDCPSSIFTNALYAKAAVFFSANSVSTGLYINTDSSTSISIKSGSTNLLSQSSTQTNFWKKIHFGATETTFFNFPAAVATSTGTTPVTLFSYDTTGLDSWAMKIRTEVIARRTDVAGDFVQACKTFLFKRVAGTNSLIDTQEVHPTGRVGNYTTADIEGTVSGNNIIVQFVGESGFTTRLYSNTWALLTN